MFKFANKFSIGHCAVGEGSPVFIIAEAGVSHFGSEEKAYRLVDLAVEARADAVKFQVFDVDAMMAPDLKEWRERLGSRQLPYKTFEKIQAYCNSKGILFFATAHDEPSLDFLVNLDVPVYKIGSGEVGNWPFMRKIARLGKPVIFSTGMYQLKQIQEALDVFSGENNPNVAVLHCVTSYPTEPRDIGLHNIALIQKQFHVISGYSDHTAGYHIPLAAVALGARIIEKHITLDYNVPNAQDWKVSCGPADLGLFVSQIRDIESALSLRDQGPTKLEKENAVWATKSLFAKHNIRKGTTIHPEDLVAKRPGTGISPSEIDRIIGRKAKTEIGKDELLKWESVD